MKQSTRWMWLVAVMATLAVGMVGCGPKDEADPSNPEVQAPEGLTPNRPDGGAAGAGGAPSAPATRAGGGQSSSL